MQKSRALSREDFDALLSWLDNDRERAAQRYEEIRSKLIRIFVSRGSPIPEELADETMDRVSHRAREIASSCSGDPALYFYGVGKNVFRESLKVHRSAPPPRNLTRSKNSARHEDPGRNQHTLELLPDGVAFDVRPFQIVTMRVEGSRR